MHNHGHASMSGVIHIKEPEYEITEEIEQENKVLEEKEEK